MRRLTKKEHHTLYALPDDVRRDIWEATDDLRVLWSLWRGRNGEPGRHTRMVLAGCAAEALRLCRPHVHADRPQAVCHPDAVLRSLAGVTKTVCEWWRLCRADVHRRLQADAGVGAGGVWRPGGSCDNIESGADGVPLHPADGKHLTAEQHAADAVWVDICACRKPSRCVLPCDVRRWMWNYFHFVRRTLWTGWKGVPGSHVHFLSGPRYMRRCDVLRSILGNPYATPAGYVRDIGGFGPRVVGGIDPSFADHDVLHVARDMVATGDYADAPVLADALEDAGCVDARVLRHLRGLKQLLPADGDVPFGVMSPVDDDGFVKSGAVTAREARAVLDGLPFGVRMSACGDAVHLKNVPYAGPPHVVAGDHVVEAAVARSLTLGYPPVVPGRRMREELP